ncbi:HERV-H LTR-associating protein 2 isoform X2 [Oenanthe melanoleuca]|nr:HERV-H LTR-associating protein 2 isoform X2 [Oenanthe melanoleuca]
MNLRTHEKTKGQNIPAVIIYLFLISATLWDFTEQVEVTGLFSKDCILPCSFPPGHDEVIHWSKENKIVHSYYRQKDQLKEQDPRYRGRTQLFHENIPSGNASLKLSNLTMTDEGSYTCYVGTTQDRKQVEVLLHLRAPSSYALEYQKTNTERRLKCYAFLTYPAPNISWVQGNVSIQETGREETMNGALYSIRSDKDIINTADTYYCHIHFHHDMWAAEWKMVQEDLSGKEGDRAVIPCDHGNDIASAAGFSVVWTLHRNAVTSILASFNGTFHSHQPRVQIDKTDFSLMLDDLTGDDSGEYLCNISTPLYTKLTVSTLHVKNSGNNWIIVLVVLGVLAAVAVVAVALYCLKKKEDNPSVNWLSGQGPPGGKLKELSNKKKERPPMNTLTIQEENSSLHTKIGDEKNKEFLHLLP